MLGVLALLAPLASAGAQTAAAPASQAAATQRYELPAGPLAETLQAIARLSGKRIDADRDAVAKARAPVVSGTLTVNQAVAQALAGTGLAVRELDSGALWVAAPGKLDSVLVEARRDQAETSFKADRSDTATRSGTSLMEVPGGVTIITSKVLETQQALSVRSALGNVSGVGFMQSPQASPTFNVRGFNNPSAMVNGVSDPSASLTNVFGVERLEVLKGPQAILSGAGSLGGGVNVVTKKPQADPIRTLTLQYGSHGDATIAGDIAGAVTEDRKLSFRLIASKADARDNDWNFDGREDTSFLPQLRWKDSSTDLILGLSYGKQHQPVPLYAFGRRDGTILPVFSFRPGRAEDGFDTEQRRAFYQLEHKFTPDLTLVSRLQRSLQETELHLRSPGGLSYATGAAPDSPRSTVSFYASRTQMFERTTSGDHYLRITGDTGPISHKLSVGVNHTSGKYYQPQWSGPSLTVQAYPPGATDPFGDLRVDASTPSSRWNLDTSQLGVYAQDLMSWGDWNLLLNLRRTRHSNEGATLYLPSNFLWATPKTVNWATTPGAGLVYNLTPQVALYGNYAEGYSPSTSQACGGGIAPPITTRNRELGAKFDLFDGKLSVTTAAFELLQSNQLQYDPLKNCSVLRDGQRTRGLEVDLQGQLAPGWNALFNYTYNNIKDVGDATTTFQGRPKHKMSLWSIYELQSEAWRGLGFGLGVSANSNSSGDYSTTYPLVIPGGAQIDVSVFYTRGPWSTTFGVKNVADRLLYATTGGNSYIPVLDGRSFMLTVKRDFK